MSGTEIPKLQVDEKKAEESKIGSDDESSDCDVDVRNEFKSCIDETISTVCRVVSMKRKGNEGQKNETTGKQ
ncbi:unnamed protein product [Caenorhabditis bovis]|uniref:Uncharacterized protein n=1 Tax=Caenorhabditis bovis TaxID=2654633 RepID=A0A8S1EFN8_9PELO|nr:unnamed protein product [Caenorhabditis bovis]